MHIAFIALHVRVFRLAPYVWRMQQLQNRSGRQLQKALVVEVAPETARSTIIRHRLKRHDRDWNDSSSLAFGSVLLGEQLVVQRPAAPS